MSKLARLLALLLVSGALLHPATSLAQIQQGRAIPGELLIRFKPGVQGSERAALRAQMNARALRRFDFIDVEHVKLDRGRAEDVIERFRRHPLVEYVEPNYEIQATLTPNDARFSELYAMRNTGQTGGT